MIRLISAKRLDALERKEREHYAIAIELNIGFGRWCAHSPVVEAIRERLIQVLRGDGALPSESDRRFRARIGLDPDDPVNAHEPWATPYAQREAAERQVSAVSTSALSELLRPSFERRMAHYAERLARNTASAFGPLMPSEEALCALRAAVSAAEKLGVCLGAVQWLERLEAVLKEQRS